MASYVVFEPPGPPRPEGAAFVRDSFRWLAFLVPFFWFLWYRLWIEAGLVFVAMIGLSALERVDGFQGVVPLVSLVLALGLGFEAPALRMAALRRRGWREWGVAEASNGDEAAIRYAAGARAEPLPGGRAVEPVPPSEHAPARRPGAGPALGLLHYPGRR
jgi:hypothetical protein